MRAQLSKHFPIPIGTLCSGHSLKVPRWILCERCKQARKKKYGPESAQPLLNAHVLEGGKKKPAESLEAHIFLLAEVLH